jgi:hypothetical protein
MRIFLRDPIQELQTRKVEWPNKLFGIAAGHGLFSDVGRPIIPPQG